MKQLLTSILLLATYIVFCQDPIAQFEGRVEIFRSTDTTSLAIGKNAGDSAPYYGCRNNAIIGTDAGTKAIGSHNSFFGSRAGRIQQEGLNNSFFGSNAGVSQVDGHNNSFFGSHSASFHEFGIGNTFIGSFSGFGIQKGDGNVLIGATVGPNFPGFSTVDSLSNRLFIHNSNTVDPLVYGEFDNRLMRINGDFETTENIHLGNDKGISFDNSDTTSLISALTVNQDDHTELNAIGDINFHTGDFTGPLFRAMTIKASRRIGIGTNDPQWRMVVKHTANALAGAGAQIDIDNLAMVLAKESNTDGEGIGIGFQSSSGTANVGAAIVHQRTGPVSKGKLHFATKTTEVDGDNLFTRLTISDDGNIGMSTTSPAERLHVIGNARISGLALSGLVDIQADNNGTLVKHMSDIRLMKDIKPIEDALEKVLHMNGVSYLWKNQEQADRTLGVIAQEVLEVVPDIVTSDGEYYGVNYSEIPALLIEAIKQQQKIINDQGLTIAGLSNDVEDLKKLLK